MREALLLIASLLGCILGFAWLALAMDVHWRQVLGMARVSRGAQIRLRTFGGIALAASLCLCLAVDHASIASLVWIMMLAAAALVVAFTLSWRPHWFAILVPWQRVEG